MQNPIQPRPVSTKGLTAKVRSALARHDRGSYEWTGRVRAISADDTARIVSAVHLGLSLARPEDHTLKVTLYGGFVANTYRRGGRADRFDLFLPLAPRDLSEIEIIVVRTSAQRRRYAEGAELVVRLMKGNQTTGRVVS